MTEEPTKPDAGDSGPVAGQRLADARRARRISVGEIARELHLDEAKVQALEQNAFEFLGAPVFIKGYLRKYATLVGLPGDEVLADYERLNHSSSAPLVIGRRPRPPRQISPGPWLAGAALIGVAVVGAWWWLSSDELMDSGPVPGELRRSSQEADAPETPDEQPLQQVPEADDLVTETAPEPEDAAVVTGTPSAEDTEPSGARQEPAPGEVELRLTFSGDCWTEVTDAGGSRLYFGLGTEGRFVSVAGVPPLQVLLGNSENVRVHVDGAQYAIPRSARRGDTARFTISP